MVVVVVGAAAAAAAAVAATCDTCCDAAHYCIRLCFHAFKRSEGTQGQPLRRCSLVNSLRHHLLKWAHVCNIFSGVNMLAACRYITQPIYQPKEKLYMYVWNGELFFLSTIRVPGNRKPADNWDDSRCTARMVNIWRDEHLCCACHSLPT